jgi:hypothetical protein
MLLAALVLSADGAPAGASPAKAAQAKSVERVGRLDIEGGGMVDVRGNLAVIGHMGPPWATSILDVSDPGRPQILSRIPVKPGTHSHKARVCGSTLITNHEGSGGGTRVGLGFTDLSDPRRPVEIGFLQMGGQGTGGTGAHRFQADCTRKLVYASGSADGFEGNFTMIVDFANPRVPQEAGRWWVPGQWVAGGEKPLLGGGGAATRTHHPLRLGDRLYVSLWMGGFAIVDIGEVARPKIVSLTNYPRPNGAPTHTALPVGHRIRGRDWLVVLDEELGVGDPPAFLRVFDITDERRPSQVATFPGPPRPAGSGRFGAHQPHEFVGPDGLVYAAWFGGGLRVIDISNPSRPVEVGSFVPEVAGGGTPLSNDVFVDAKGLIYLFDRRHGLDILRYTGERPSR